jgi:hypothetical protein
MTTENSDNNEFSAKENWFFGWFAKLKGAIRGVLVWIRGRVVDGIASALLVSPVVLLVAARLTGPE